jgi:hypothetical protein
MEYRNQTGGFQKELGEEELGTTTPLLRNNIF